MEFEKKKVFPESVGKRIIEALRTSGEPEKEEVQSYRQKPSYSYCEEPARKDYNCADYATDSENRSFASERYDFSEEYDEPKTDEIALSNIDVLVDLITKLPPGVTKQTGAGIIRHTMEAAGISMDKLLAGAQRTREESDREVQNNIDLIEEYRAKIKFLDREICRCRKQGQELANIINLFILSDGKN